MKKIVSLFIVLCLTIPLVSFAESASFGTGKVYVREKGGTLHIRSAATTESESLGFVHHGDEIDVLMLGDEWSYIFSYREYIRGYIKTKYIIDFVPSENMFTETTIHSVSASSETYPMPGSYRLDLDGDGTIDTVNASLFYNEYGTENFTIIFETAYGSSGEATIPFSSYDAKIAFAKLDDTNRVYVFVTGDVASTDFETYAFYVDQGRMENVVFAPNPPFSEGIGTAGMLEKIDQGNIFIIPVLDVLGTRFYRISMKMENDKVVPVENAVYETIYDSPDYELWEYASLKANASVPCVIDGNESVLDPGTKILVTWLNVNQKEIGFITQNGLTGYFKYSEAMDHDWGVYVGGVYESDAFEFIPYAG